KIGPRKFLFARPDNLHWLLGSASEPCCFNRRFASVFAAVSRARVRHQDLHAFLRNVKRGGEFFSHSEGALGAGPNRQLIAVPLSECRTWFEGRMRDVGYSVSCGRYLGRRRGRRGSNGFFRVVSQILEDILA